MDLRTWTPSPTRRAHPHRLPLRLTGIAVIAASLWGCPLSEGNPDGGPRGDMDVVCTTEYAPVCGVDGVTYGNACTANARGVLVSHVGECFEPPGVRCGGVYGDSCAPNEYCDYSGTGADIIALPVPIDVGVAPPPAPTGICRPRPVEYCTGDEGCEPSEYCDFPVPHTDAPQFIPEPIPAPMDAGVIVVDAGAGHSDAGIVAPPLGVCRPREPRYCYVEDDPACAEGEYCDLSGVGIDFAPPAPGDEDRPLIAPPPGVCRPVVDPGECPNVDALVCGSNGITYQNACVAESMGATVVAEGRCPPGGLRGCGGWLGDTCSETEYCYFEPGTWCDYADASGVCLPRPEACTREYAPVCGCDGQTYGNPCDAASQGTSVATVGACQTDPVPGGEGSTCGGFAGTSCHAGLYCLYSEEALCGAADASGVCALVPDACPDIWLPVCGCDGQIYGNDCEAASAGVSVGPRSNCLAP